MPCLNDSKNMTIIDRCKYSKLKLKLKNKIVWLSLRLNNIGSLNKFVLTENLFGSIMK